ncbi:MAG TPA: hypothetical protein VHC67_17860 [Gaiellaceae bacterium]|nr:hypothetical protein [Gaiellaceae bacterium]
MLLCACATLAAPAAASAHARTTTVALDYRLALDRTAVPGVHASILDGDRSLRLATAGATVVVRGDLGEPMLRITRQGTWANRASTTAVAERLVSSGSGWQQVGHGPSYTWHEHRLAPPPFGSKTGPVARFTIPLTVDGRPAAIGGTFVRHARPALWPWLAAAAAFAAAVALAVRTHLAVTTPLGAAAGLAALGSLVAFSVADAPNGQVAWLQIALGTALAAALYAVLIRAPQARRPAVAGILGGVAAAVSLGSLGVFRHGVVVSALPGTASRALLELAFLAGVAAAATSLRGEARR